MSANQARFPIVVMARVLGVSDSGFHAWRHRPPSARAEADAVLLKRMRTIHASSRGMYGAPRIHAELRAGEEKHGRKGSFNFRLRLRRFEGWHGLRGQRSDCGF